MLYFLGLLLIPLFLEAKHNCPGDTFQCDDSATCCQLLDKSYGCCPLKDAVCCDDHIHCCPINTKCSSGMCIQQVSDTFTNTSSHLIKAKSNNVTCPGDKYTCPDDTTCCEGSEPGTYGCCPLEDAVCCKDKQHCCPSGTTCNLVHQTCNGDNFVSQMYDSGKRLFKSQVAPPAQLIERLADEVSSVVCPGGSFQCPNGYTCCMLKNGNWGCCPFPSATCCEDKIHCCPEKMHCDVTSSFCSQGGYNITSSPNIPAVPIHLKKIICPDKSECQDTMTCCLLSDAKYGCCTYQNATCCSDRLHCCPNGSKCDVEKKRCITQGHWLLNAIF